MPDTGQTGHSDSAQESALSRAVRELSAARLGAQGVSEHPLG